MTQQPSSTAFLFPGQGAQSIGMGKELFDNFTEAKEVFQEVDDALNQKLSALMFTGGEAELGLTTNTQPALMACSVAAARVLEKQAGKKLADLGAYIAGHSLGEYSALCAAGAISLADTARLLRTRGNAMQEAVPAGIGSMGAVMGADIEKAESLAKAASSEGPCEVANDNSPDQVVISGAKAAIEKAAAIAGEHGAKRVIILKVSAPFHSSLMQPAAEVMQQALAETTIVAPAIPVVNNVTATATTDPEIIRNLLVEQVTGRVRWRETMALLGNQGITCLVELGSGKVLAGLARKSLPEVTTFSLGTPEAIDAFLSEA